MGVLAWTRLRLRGRQLQRQGRIKNKPPVRTATYDFAASVRADGGGSQATCRALVFTVTAAMSRKDINNVMVRLDEGGAAITPNPALIYMGNPDG